MKSTNLKLTCFSEYTFFHKFQSFIVELGFVGHPFTYEEDSCNVKFELTAALLQQGYLVHSKDK